jgi:hypothetical protein
MTHVEMRPCFVQPCNDAYQNDKWSKIRAAQAGWFFPKYGDIGFCPNHLPEWVPAWRERQKEKKGKEKK